MVFNKDAKRAAQEAKIQARYEEEREERERTMMRVRETQDRIGRVQADGRGGDNSEELLGSGASGRGRYKSAEQLATRKEQKKRYQFEATGSDDELEDELDDNLDEISDMTKRLKALGSAMNAERKFGFLVCLTSVFIVQSIQWTARTNILITLSKRLSVWMVVSSETLKG